MSAVSCRSQWFMDALSPAKWSSDICLGRPCNRIMDLVLLSSWQMKPHHETCSLLTNVGCPVSFEHAWCVEIYSRTDIYQFLIYFNGKHAHCFTYFILDWQNITTDSTLNHQIWICLNSFCDMSIGIPQRPEEWCIWMARNPLVWN